MILSAPSTCEAGVTLAERLGLGLVKREGNNLAGPCPYPGCGSSDAFRLEVNTGIGHCFACGQKSSAYALAEMRLRTSFAATQLLKDLRLWRESETSQCIDPIGTVAVEKQCPREALVMFGAIADDGCVRIPTWGPDGKPLGNYAKATGNGTACGHFRMWPGAKGDTAKGLCEKGRRAGVFFPGRLPQPGESWVIVEGVKDSAALLGIGYAVAGLHGNTMHEEYGRLFRGVHVILCPDGDKASHEGARKNVAIFQAAGAASIRVAILPVPIRESHGDDVRDVIRQHGPDAVRKAVDGARPANEVVLSTRSTTQPPSASAPASIAPGTKVRALDRENYGEVVSDNGDTCIVHFISPEGQHADVSLPKSQLVTADGKRLDGSGLTIPEPCTATQLVQSHPRLRPAAIHRLLRIGETMNVVADPKRGKSWAVNGLALCKASGTTWLETFECDPGRVLIIDGELHPEVIAYRLPVVADAMGIDRSVLDLIDVLPLRGCGVDLLTLQPFVESIEPGRYALVILDAWYRFLPPGFSENDNAQVMALYNKIDGYTAHLQSAWINVHHASKGDQSGKSTTDVGSGAGSQSRAADTHLIIRPHEQDDVAVVEAVVRSWPPVEPLAIRWSYPTWQLDSADPRKLRRPRDRNSKEASASRLEEDRQAIVCSMTKIGRAETKTTIRNETKIRTERFGFAWQSLVSDGTIATTGRGTKGNNVPYDLYSLAEQQDE